MAPGLLLQFAVVKPAVPVRLPVCTTAGWNVLEQVFLAALACGASEVAEVSSVVHPRGCYLPHETPCGMCACEWNSHAWMYV